MRHDRSYRYYTRLARRVFWSEVFLAIGIICWILFIAVVLGTYAYALIWGTT